MNHSLGPVNPYFSAYSDEDPQTVSQEQKESVEMQKNRDKLIQICRTISATPGENYTKNQISKIQYAFNKNRQEDRWSTTKIKGVANIIKQQHIDKEIILSTQQHLKQKEAEARIINPDLFKMILICSKNPTENGLPYTPDQIMTIGHEFNLDRPADKKWTTLQIETYANIINQSKLDVLLAAQQLSAQQKDAIITEKDSKTLDLADEKNNGLDFLKELQQKPSIQPTLACSSSSHVLPSPIEVVLLDENEIDTLIALGNETDLKTEKKKYSWKDITTKFNEIHNVRIGPPLNEEQLKRCYPFYYAPFNRFAIKLRQQILEKGAEKVLSPLLAQSTKFSLNDAQTLLFLSSEINLETNLPYTNKEIAKQLNSRNSSKEWKDTSVSWFKTWLRNQYEKINSRSGDTTRKNQQKRKSTNPHNSDKEKKLHIVPSSDSKQDSVYIQSHSISPPQASEQEETLNSLSANTTIADDPLLYNDDFLQLTPPLNPTTPPSADDPLLYNDAFLQLTPPLNPTTPPSADSPLDWEVFTRDCALIRGQSL